MKHSFIDEDSRVPSPIRSLDPRIKCISFLALVIFIISTPPGAWLSLSLYAVIIVCLVWISRIPGSKILKKVLIIAPFSIITAMFLLFMDTHADSVGAPVLFGTMAAKSVLAMASIVLLVSSTPFPALLKSFETLKCPTPLVMVLSFMYRYLFVIEDEFMRMRQAKASRQITSHKRLEARILASLLGVLFVRSYERAEAVYLAMCCRGFQGQIRTLDRMRVRKADIVFLVIILASTACIRSFSS